MNKISASFPMASRSSRQLDSDGPKEFFYGTDNLSKNYKVEYVDSRIEPKSYFLCLLLFLEKIINRFTKFGIYKTRVFENKRFYNDSNIIISFTDSYSINLGLFYKKKKDQKLIGVFHGLSDFELRIPFFL